MKTDAGRTHITDDQGNNVVTVSPRDKEYDALCAVAEAADQTHRSRCLLPTVNCPICKTLADLDAVRQHKVQAG